MARMHQTTLRFGSDLWQALEHESGRLGVSVAQYVRDAALARLSFARGLEFAQGPGAAGGPPANDRSRLEGYVREQLDSVAAVRAQGHLTRERSRQLRDRADRIRARSQG